MVGGTKNVKSKKQKFLKIRDSFFHFNVCTLKLENLSDSAVFQAAAFLGFRLEDYVSKPSVRDIPATCSS